MQSKFAVGFAIVTVLVVLGVAGNYIVTLGQPSGPMGTSINVNTNLDSLNLDGMCSLREAVRAANLDIPVDACPAGNGADIILLQSQVYTLSLTGTYEDAALTGDLDITEDLEIRGNGADLTTISGNAIDRVLHIDPQESGIQVKLSSLTIRDGSAPANDDEGGGGILSNGIVIIENVIVSGNNANRGGGVRIDLSGESAITDTIISNNHADDEGGGIYGDGTIEMERVEIIENSARRGGGVFCDRPCTFVDVSISGNLAITHGGGIYNDDISVLTNVTINDNRVIQQDGGGIYNEDEITLQNVTVSGNAASQGSGIFSDTVAHLKSVTIYQNDSPIFGASLFNDLRGSIDLVNTIVANDRQQPNCSGDLVSMGHNLSGDASCNFSQATDLQSTDPMLDPLLDNSGETKTHALQSGSPAVDAGKDLDCLPYDQRYLSRPVDGNQDGIAHCDIGAYEIMPGGSIRFQQLDYAVDESVGHAQLAVERTEGSAGIVSISYFTWEGFEINHANRNADYLSTYGTLTWQGGDSSIKYIEVPIVDDPSQENDEIFYVMLHNPIGGAGMSNTARVAAVTILDNDPPPAEWATPVPEPDKVYMPVINE